MAAWLRLDLASTTATWIIAFWHHPPYSKGTHDSDAESQLIDMRTGFNPILEQGGVDLVFCGHSHNYERSFLLDGHYGTSGTLTPAMRKNPGNGSVAGFTTSDSGVIRRAPDFIATATTSGVLIPGDGAYIKPLTGPRDHFGAVYNTAGMSGEVYGSESIDHPAMCVSYNQLGTVNLDVNGNTLKATFVQAGGLCRTISRSPNRARRIPITMAFRTPMKSPTG
ncbi:MAG: metallophosphoesterase [Luteolibacter sp.]|uniref:metallophosphoesterase family protein n=1 Tax=Luteolibacter sp. TaxID=1962973 RepID=UPI0032670AFA